MDIIINLPHNLVNHAILLVKHAHKEALLIAHSTCILIDIADGEGCSFCEKTYKCQQCQSGYMLNDIKHCEKCSSECVECQGSIFQCKNMCRWIL